MSVGSSAQILGHLAVAGLLGASFATTWSRAAVLDATGISMGCTICDYILGGSIIAYTIGAFYVVVRCCHIFMGRSNTYEGV